MRWSVAAVMLAITSAVALCFVEVWTTRHVTAVNGHERTSTTSATIVQARPEIAAVVLLAPVVVTMIAVLLVGRPGEVTIRRLAITFLTLELPFGYFTIGGFFLPSLVTMLLAARAFRRMDRASRTR